MKKIILFTLLFLNVFYFCFAQKGQKFNRAEAIQVAYLTKELSLTTEEAQKFWPVFNTYKDEIKRARKENKEDEIDFEEKIVNIRKKSTRLNLKRYLRMMGG